MTGPLGHRKLSPLVDATTNEALEDEPQPQIQATLKPILLGNWYSLVGVRVVRSWVAKHCRSRDPRVQRRQTIRLHELSPRDLPKKHKKATIANCDSTDRIVKYS
jgi:hypothetical protein